MIIKDNFNIADGFPIKGVVKLTLPDGKIIFKENLVTTAGRTMIMDIFKGHIKGSSDTKYEYVGMGHGFSSRIPTLDDGNFEVDTVIPVGESNPFNGNQDTTLQFTLTVSGDNSSGSHTKLNYLGLVFNKVAVGNTDVEILATRVMFDTIYLSAGDSVEIEYHLYF